MSFIAKEKVKSFIPSDSLKLAQIMLLGFLSWYFLKPEALSDNGWQLLCIFVTTIVAIIAKPLPMGAISLTSVAVLCLTKTISLQTALAGFAYDQLWLIVFACFLARGFIKTGLGKRIAYLFVSLFGGTPYGMGYGLVVSSFCMAPLIPSTLARTGGIILPVLRSIISVVNQPQVAAFLTLVVMHASVITSAMFITASAVNPIVVKFAASLGVEITWISWAKAAFIPGALSLILMPIFLKFLIPCNVADAQKISQHAKEELGNMGRVTWQEKVLLAVLALLLILWAFGSALSVHAAEAALFGVTLLLLAKVLTWKDILAEDLAWDTFLWMGILIMMASEMQNLGVIGWFTDSVAGQLPSFSWHWQFLIIALIYYYTHYFFASVAAHVSSMYGPFLAVAIAAGAPPMASALLMGFLSSLFGALTHYSSGPAPILYSEQHIDIKKWWKIGFLTSLFYIILWVGCGTVTLL